MTDDPRVRLLNRLYARKSKELKDIEKVKNVEVAEERMDKRLVDDLLSCINGGDAKKQVKRQFVTAHQLQQQQKNKKARQLDSLKSPQGGYHPTPPPPLTEYEIERAIRV
ncbi:hypothetical protein POM88_000623 [Heracleum sosnowskyi]|uniref:Uncharacterized protein n=1 Tax=Heracleum sosnowskyi TaxID=360622 RepID=A0AAD8JBW6_9APIA|nr:hypothetical protein POM88_000623 [Heracleum sosnowskyi]